MKIIVEALGIGSYGGGRTATINLLQAMLAIDQENQYLLLLSQPEPLLEAANVQQKIVPLQNRFAARVWVQLRLPWLAREYDLVHFIKNLGAFGVPARTVVTVYDMTTLLYPELFPRSDVLYWRYIQKWTLRRADRVIAISKQTADDAQRFYGLPERQLAVIYPSCGRQFQPAPEAEIARIRAHYRLPEAYVLHVGRIDPKNNIPLLIQAFARFKEGAAFPGKLILIGEQYKKKPDLTVTKAIATEGLEDSVRLLGALPDGDLPAFYSGAVMTAVPSIHEGFGLVALEALRCGSPLIVNRAGAITEVVGDAALVMSESSPDCMADLLTALWQEPARRQELRRKGLERAKMFDWTLSAQQTLQLYQEVAGSQ